MLHCTHDCTHTQFDFTAPVGKSNMKRKLKTTNLLLFHPLPPTLLMQALHISLFTPNLSLSLHLTIPIYPSSTSDPIFPSASLFCLLSPWAWAESVQSCNRLTPSSLPPLNLSVLKNKNTSFLLHQSDEAAAEARLHYCWEQYFCVWLCVCTSQSIHQILFAFAPLGQMYVHVCVCCAFADV